MTRYVCLTALLLVVACSRPPIDAPTGRRLYLSYGCAACHGENGDGQGPGAAASGIKPRDLRDLSGYTRGTSRDQIAQTIAVGFQASGMPSYGELPPYEREAIAVWIQSIAKEKR